MPLHTILKSLFPAILEKYPQRGRRRPTAAAAAESLECRTLLTVLHWTGAANTANTWSTSGNWQENRVPIAGDDLVFADVSSTSELTSVNDFQVPRLFNSIEITRGGHSLQGNRIDLGAGGFKVTGPANGNASVEVRAAVNLTAPGTDINVSSRTLLNLTGVVSGIASVNINKAGTGTLRYAGSASNTFVGTTHINEGTLELGKAGDGVNAIAGPLEIGDFAGTAVAASVKLTSSEQINNNIPITVHRSGRLNLNGFNEIVGPLQVNGNGKVDGPNSRLTLASNVSSALLGGTAPQSAEINVKEIVLSGRPELSTTFNLGSIIGKTFTLNAAISGHGLTQNGGTLVMAGNAPNTYTGVTRVSLGVLQLAKSNGVVSVPGDLNISPILVGATPKVKLMSAGQVASRSNLTMSNAELDLNGQVLTTLNIVAASSPSTTLTMTGSTIRDSSTGGKIQMPAVINVLPSASPTKITAVAEFGRLFSSQASTPAGIFHDVHISPSATLILERPVFANGISSEFSRIDVVGAGKLEWGNGSIPPDTTLSNKVTVEVPLLTLRQASPTTIFVVGANTVVDGRNQQILEIFATLPADNTAVLSPGTPESPTETFRTSDCFSGILRLDLNGTGPGQHDLIAVDNPTIVGLGGVFDNGRTPMFGRLDIRLNFASAVGDEFGVVSVTTTAHVDPALRGPNGGDLLVDGSTLQVSGQTFRVNYRTVTNIASNFTTTAFLTHVNTTPAFQNRTLTRSIVEGEEAVLRGVITEPDTLDTFFLDVDWGDGTLENLSFPAGTDPSLALRHRYLKDGNYNVNLAWHDQHNTGLRTSVEKITVRNALPSFRNVTISSPVAAGAIVALRGTLFDRGLNDNLRLTIRWGDGTGRQEVNIAAGDRDFVINHQFAHRGRHWITLIASDESGHAVRHFLLAIVRNAAS